LINASDAGYLKKFTVPLIGHMILKSLSVLY
jgi:hypothetical protein